ncbi:hypothetical protein HRG09_27570 [Bacillus sp. Xin1]|uniref:hypothetical protein n=1 Tax=Bacillus sp. Xin1 TaxID=2740676 RepID=UPI001572E785|nr:hypothetical protein [Bacillus sp. Xin1]NSW39622.1 hypothetical protein [Bacillus sp. Xin1]
MSNCHGSHFNCLSSVSVPCPTPSPISVPFPRFGLGSGFLAAQDGAIPQIITVPLLGGTPITTTINFNTALPGDETTITPSIVLPLDPGGGGTFNALEVTATGIYDINAGLSLIGLLATLPAGSGIIAQVVRVPAGSTTPVPLTPISFLGPFTALAGIIAVLGLARGTVQLQDVPLVAGDRVQIQIFVPAVGLAAGVLAVSYAFLEIASQ